MDTTVVAAIIAAVALLAGYSVQQHASASERKRKASAEAIADALQWLEMPYRIRRRMDDGKATLTALADRFHHLQERLAFHESWLRIEMPGTETKYKDLVVSIRSSALEPIREAWKTPPISTAAEMNVGDLGLDNPEDAVAVFSNEVRKKLGLWPW